MRANKAILNNEVLIDLTQDTAVEADVLEGKTFHKADGSVAVGTATLGDSEMEKVFSGTATELHLPNLTAIADMAFYQNTSPISVFDAPNLKSIGRSAFYTCTNLRVTSLPNNITHLYDYAFASASMLALTSLPDNLQYIGNYAFQSCVGLKTLIIPASVNEIGSSAFYNCTGLTSITFKGKPSKGIKLGTFAGCTNLTTINVPWASGEVANAPWGASNANIVYGYTEG